MDELYEDDVMDESVKVYVIFRKNGYDWDGLERLIAGILTDRGDAIKTVERLNAEPSNSRYIVEEYPLNTEIGLRTSGFGRTYDSWDDYYEALETERQNEARESAKSDALYIVETEVREIFMGERNRLNELEKTAHADAKTNSTVDGVVDKARMKAARADVTGTFAARRDQLNKSQTKAMNDALAVLGDVTENDPEWEMVLPKALDRARGHLRSETDDTEH